MSETSFSRREQASLVTDAIPPSLRRHGATPRQLLALCLVGALVLALFASRDTPGWADRLGDSDLDHAVRRVAGSWDSAMEQLGLTRPHETLRDAIRRVLDWRWSAK